MVYLSAAALRKVQDLSWHLGGCRTQADLEAAAILWLFDNIPCLHASFTDYPAQYAPTRVAVEPSEVQAAEIDLAVKEHFSESEPSDHPLIAHYFYQWHDVTPLRTSDLISDRQLRTTRLYSQVFRPFGVTHQIALVSRRCRWPTTPVMPSCGRERTSPTRSSASPSPSSRS